MTDSKFNCCDYLPWDSEFFGLRIAKLLARELSCQAAEEMKDWCQSKAIDCLYCLADIDDLQSIRTIEEYRFQFIDLRITLSKLLEKHSVSNAGTDVGIVRRANTEDMTKLAAIARVSHHDSRFYMDSHFERTKCDLLYETWVAKAFQGSAEAILVAEYENKVAGYIVCNLADERVGVISLLAIDSSMRGRGLGTALVNAAVGLFRQNGRQRASVVTQGRNIGAQRCYQHSGFSTESMQLWYHWWPSERLTLPGGAATDNVARSKEAH